MTPAELDEIEREAAVGSYGAIARTRKAVPALVARVRELESKSTHQPAAVAPIGKAAEDMPELRERPVVAGASAAGSCAELDELERLAKPYPPTGCEEATCAACGEHIRVPFDAEWEDGDICFECEAARGSKVQAAMPTIIARVRELEANCNNACAQLDGKHEQWLEAERRAQAAEARCKELEGTCETIRNDWRALMTGAEIEIAQLLARCKELEEAYVAEAETWQAQLKRADAALTQLRAQVETMRGALEKLSSAASDGLTALGHLGAVQPVRGHLWDALDEAERVLAGKASR